MKFVFFQAVVPQDVTKILYLSCVYAW